MKNAYEVRGDVTAIFLRKKDGSLLETSISTSKLERANELPRRWYATYSRDIQRYYAVSNRKKVRTSLHRWITKCPNDMQVDHINHDTLDNTDENLRVVTQAENKQNLSGAYSTSKSGIRGVTWHKIDRKWTAQFHLNGKKTHLGCFENIADAEKAVIEARMRHMPFSNENI